MARRRGGDGEAWAKEKGRKRRMGVGRKGFILDVIRVPSIWRELKKLCF